MLKDCWNEVIFSEDMVNEFKNNGRVKYQDLDLDLPNNQGVVINGSLLGVYDSTKQIIRKLVTNPFGDMKPKENNRGLKLLYDYLWNPNISVVCVNAPAGTGKTSTAMAYAIQKIIIEGQKDFKNLAITRPNVEVGRGHGFLPGTLEEKLEPLNAAFMQWMDRLCQFDYENRVKDEKEPLLVMQPISFIRGIDIQDQIFIVDECQNLTKHEMKTILTRVGEKSKVILIGDTSENQIDSKILNSDNNGLAHVIDRWHGKYEWFAYVELTEILRGPVCKAAVKDL